MQPAPRSIDRGTTRPSNPAKADEKADTVGLSSAKPALDGNQPALIKQTSAEPSIGTVRVLGHRGCDVNTQGWFLSVGNPEQYDFKVSEDGETIEIHPVVPEPTGNFEFVHCADPGPLAGKRIRFSARIKAKGVTKTANLRLRGENSNRQRIAYSEQKVGNSHDWSEFTADLDVGNEVALLSYGLTFRSPGRIWMSHPELSIIR